MNCTTEATTVSSYLRAAYGPGYQVALDPERVVRASPIARRRRT